MQPRLRFEVFTLFPEVFEPYLETSILQRARLRGLVEVGLHNIRNWTYDRHHVTDDIPYGGGGGMVMKPEPVFAAVEAVLGSPPDCPVILMTPQGRRFDQKLAMELAGVLPPDPELLGKVVPGDVQLQALSDASEESGEPNLLPVRRLALVCGRYEGVDERVRAHLATEEISIGDFVLSGGELAALVVIDAVARLIPGVLGDPDGAMDDSHTTGLLEYPHFTRPPEFRGWRVPDVLLSGDHARISRWRREQALLRTFQRRPDLLAGAPLSKTDRAFLAKLQSEQNEGNSTDQR